MQFDRDAKTVLREIRGRVSRVLETYPLYFALKSRRKTRKTFPTCRISSADFLKEHLYWRKIKKTLNYKWLKVSEQKTSILPLDVKDTDISMRKDKKLIVRILLKYLWSFLKIVDYTNIEVTYKIRSYVLHGVMKLRTIIWKFRINRFEKHGFEKLHFRKFHVTCQLL